MSSADALALAAPPAAKRPRTREPTDTDAGAAAPAHGDAAASRLVEEARPGAQHQEAKRNSPPPPPLAARAFDGVENSEPLSGLDMDSEINELTGGVADPLTVSLLEFLIQRVPRNPAA